MAETVLEFKVTVRAERVTGKFASNDELREVIRDNLETNGVDDINGVGADGETEYTINDVTVEDL
jgi:hypothetical protein